MENIISDILKIEESAQKRLADAEQASIKIIADAKAEKEALINSKIQEAKTKIELINADEKSKIQNTLSEINQGKLEQIEYIDEIYKSKHSEWEENIFNQIING